jgi:hypothetical protein
MRLREIGFAIERAVEGVERLGGAALLGEHHADVGMGGAGTDRLRERFVRFRKTVLLGQRESQVDVIAFQARFEPARFAEGPFGFAPASVLVMMVAVIIPQSTVARRSLERPLEVASRQFVIAQPSVEHRQAGGDTRHIGTQGQDTFILSNRLGWSIALIELLGGFQA